MPDENENEMQAETEDVSIAPEEPAVEEAPAAEVEQPEPDAEQPAPEAEAEPPEPESAGEPEQPAPEAEAELPEPESAGEPESSAEGAAEEPDPGQATPAEREPKKRKRLPRTQRRQRPKVRRSTTGERKPITRLPKPEHERGRRQERQGVVVSAAADKTIVVRVDVVKLHPVYKKVVRRSTKLHAHDERNEAKAGDVVRLVETRPLSRMKRWRLEEIVEAAK